MTDVVVSIGPLLAESAIKATVVLAAALAAAAAFRTRSAAYRHGIWTAALAGAVALPLLASAAPSLPLLPAWPEAELRLAPAPAAPDPAAPGASTVAPAFSSDTVDRGAPERAAVPASRSWIPEWPLEVWLVLLWAAGAGVVLARYGIGLVAARRLVRHAQPLDDLQWEDRLLDAVGRLDLRVAPPLLISSATPVPLTCGIRKPVIVLPEDARAWTDQRSAIVLLHELAHIRRRDCLVQALVQLACAAYWFHPLVWVAARRLRAERERACDDLVLIAGTPGPDYAEQLLGIARAARRAAPAAAAALAMARVSELEGRLLAILDASRSRGGVSLRGSVRLAVPIVALVTVLAALEPAARAAITPHAEAAAAPQTRDIDAADGTAIAEQQPPAPAPAPAPTPAPTPSPAPAPSPAPSRAGKQAVAEGAAGAVPQAVIEALREALNDVDADVRQQALAALARMDGSVPLEALTTAAGDKDPEVRAHALVLIGQRRDPKALSILTGALKDPSKDVREAAASGLAQLRSREAIPALTAALADESADVRESAMFALAELKAKEALPAIITGLEDPSPDVREQAAFALSQFRDPSTVGALTTALGDESADVRENVVFALSQIRDRSTVPALTKALGDESPDVRQQAAFALGQIRDRAAVEPLLAALKDPADDVREQAAFALGQLGDPRAFDALTAALKDKSADVRQQAAFALSQLAGSER